MPEAFIWKELMMTVDEASPVIGGTGVIVTTTLIFAPALDDVSLGVHMHLADGFTHVQGLSPNHTTWNHSR
jgi:hypothetical protein